MKNSTAAAAQAQAELLEVLLGTLTRTDIVRVSRHAALSFLC